MVRLKEKKKERTAQEEIISHPSRYILQTIQCFSEPTIRGQPEESKPPPSSLRKKKGTVSEREKKNSQYVSGTAGNTRHPVKVGINESFMGNKSRGAMKLFLASIPALLQLLTFRIGRIHLFQITRLIAPPTSALG